MVLLSVVLHVWELLYRPVLATYLRVTNVALLVSHLATMLVQMICQIGTLVRSETWRRSFGIKMSSTKTFQDGTSVKSKAWMTCLKGLLLLTLI